MTLSRLRSEATAEEYVLWMAWEEMQQLWPRRLVDAVAGGSCYVGRVMGGSADHKDLVPFYDHDPVRDAEVERKKLEAAEIRRKHLKPRKACPKASA